MIRSTQKHKYETKCSKEGRCWYSKQSTQECKIHEIRVTDETVNQAAVPLLILHQWQLRGNLRHDHRMSENPWYTWWKIAIGKKRDGIAARPWRGNRVGPIWRRGGIPVVCRWWSQLCPTHQWERWLGGWMKHGSKSFGEPPYVWRIPPYAMIHLPSTLIQFPSFLRCLFLSLRSWYRSGRTVYVLYETQTEEQKGEAWERH